MSSRFAVKYDDDAWLPQIELPAKWALRVGGVREILMQSLGFLSLPNGVMIALTWYRGSEVVQAAFPSALHFLTVYIAVALLVMAMYYVIGYPAWQKFVHHQSDQEDRSPGYALAVEINDRQQRLEAKVDSVLAGRPLAVPECCRDGCSSGAVNAEHKGEPVIKCADCDGILYRRLEG